MQRRDRSQTLVIGGRELAILAVALGFLALAIFVVAFGATRLGARRSAANATATAGTAAIGNVTLRAASTATLQSIGTQAGGPQDGTPAPQASQFDHVVQPGETLGTIATFYGITVSDLLNANNMTLSSVIRDGQTIAIPLPPSQAGTWHVVQSGETLISLAEQYGITPEAIQTANYLSNADTIFVGQRLRIPGVPPEITPAPTSIASAGQSGQAVPVSDIPARIVFSDWPRSILDGDLAGNYPLTSEQERFTLHYQPRTYADQHLDETITLVQTALDEIERTLNVHLDGRFDVYVAGTLFAAPNANLHGLSQSADRRVFILHDGSGTDADNLYFFIHEITHLVAWNTWGVPSSTMLSEGVATYSGKRILEGGGYLPYDQFCTAAYAAGLMPSMVDIERDWQSFLGHIRHPVNYFGSACFVGYLINTYGLDKMATLYHSSDYQALYGKSLADLDSDWKATLAAHQGSLTVDPKALADYTDEVGNTYGFVVNNFADTDVLHQAYGAVDQARIALWKGDYDATRRWLDTVYAVLGYKP